MPDDPGWVYYAARATLVVLWLLASRRAFSLFRKARRPEQAQVVGGGIWLGVSLTCFYLAILRTTRFDWHFKFWAQAQAEERGLQEVLRNSEVALFVVIVVCAILLLLFFQRKVSHGQAAPALALVASLLMVLLRCGRRSLWTSSSQASF